MAITIPRRLVEFILLGPEDDRRQLQDSPLLGDVWMKFAADPGARLELLITPHKDHAAGKVASTLVRALAKEDLNKLTAAKNVTEKAEAKKAAMANPEIRNVAYLQGVVAAKLTFEEVLEVVIPMSSWWARKRTSEAVQEYFTQPARLDADINSIFRAAKKWHSLRGPLWKEGSSQRPIQDYEAHQRYVALGGLLLWAKDVDRPDGLDERLLDSELANQVAAKLRKKFRAPEAVPTQPMIWTVSMNRRASAAISRSVPAVKADAAMSLFKVDCGDIVWAVLDSGIDGGHSAFLGNRDRAPRIKRSFDFTRIREIVSLSNLDRWTAERRTAMLRRDELLEKPPRKSVLADLRRLAEGADAGRPIDWGLVEPLVEIKPMTVPSGNHGTHVAGILGACRSEQESGMCPDITIYDFRVLAPTLEETEFAIMAALQFIRYVNERNSYLTIHGANLSLSIPHEVRNYGCGQTPICNECERLVNSGVVVVAAAGNRGYQNFQTSEGVFENYAAFSVTDPGNGDSVITVGATHRYSPHTYGVSFFSSRGPTGDGRMKPDLVAPGERIHAPFPGQQWGDLDGTSMAAPHVSGAAAMLMARYPELIGQPRRIKEILCRSATDLGRERSFQGHGMLDVLRAFQSI